MLIAEAAAQSHLVTKCFSIRNPAGFSIDAKNLSVRRQSGGQTPGPVSTPAANIQDAAAPVQLQASPHQLQKIPVPPVVSRCFQQTVGRVPEVGTIRML